MLVKLKSLLVKSLPVDGENGNRSWIIHLTKQRESQAFANFHY